MKHLIFSLLFAASAVAAPVEVLSVRAVGPNGISVMEARAILHRVKRVYKQEVGIRIVFVKRRAADAWPETHCGTPECKYQRRELWRQKLSAKKAKYKLVMMPFIEVGLAKVTGGAADGICLSGLATVNLQGGDPDKNAAIVAHELGHLFGATHVTEEEKPTIMNPIYGQVTLMFTGISVRFTNLHFAPDSIYQIDGCLR